MRTAAPVARRRSYGEERRFGWTVGTVLLLVGAYLAYRGRSPWISGGAAAVGGTLVLLGTAAPALLVQVNRGWMALAHALGAVMTRVILGVLFFVVLTPLGVMRRLAGADPLARRGPGAPSYWGPYPERYRDPAHYRKMF